MKELMKILTEKVNDYEFPKKRPEKVIDLSSITIDDISKTLERFVNGIPKDKSIPRRKLISFQIFNNELEIEIPFEYCLVIEGFFTSLLRNRVTPQYSKYETDKKFFIENNVQYMDEHKLMIIGHDTISALSQVHYENLKYNENLFLYTNIIEEVHVGSEMLKLLKVIPVTKEFDEVCSEIFYFPHYVNLDTRFVDRVRLYLCDSEGNKIRFTDEHSRVIYKLHFRPKNYSSHV